jgi:hypothetical protein
VSRAVEAVTGTTPPLPTPWRKVSSL